MRKQPAGRDSRSQMRHAAEPEMLDEFYREEDPWGYRLNPEDDKRRRVLLAEIPQRHFAATLDLGCGNGFVTAHLPGDRVVGVDISRNAIKHARKHQDDRLSFLVSDIFDLRSDSRGTYDLIIITGLFYPQYVRAAGLVAQLRVDELLNPGGILISVHIDEWYTTRFPYLMTKQITYPYRTFTHVLEVYVK